MKPPALAALAAAVGLAGPAVAADPPRPDRPEFTACPWREVRGATLSMWAFDCPAGVWYERLVADDSLPGFAVVGAMPADGKPYRRVVVRVFAKPAGAPLDAIMPAVRRASPGLSPACRLSPARAYADRGGWVLGPTGPANARWMRQREDDDGAEPPCGAMGVDVYGDRFFQVAPGHPDRVLYLDLGHEVQVFDDTTLRLRP